MATVAETATAPQAHPPRPKPVPKPTKFGLKRKPSYDDVESSTAIVGGDEANYVSEPSEMLESEQTLVSPIQAGKKSTASRSSSFFSRLGSGSEKRALLEEQVEALTREKADLENENKRLTSEKQDWEDEKRRLQAEIERLKDLKALGIN